MDADFDLEDMPPKVLRKIIRSLMSKMSAKPGERAGRKDADTEKEDKERDDLADLHEETKGAGPKQPVKKDDLPFEIDDEMMEDEGESESEGPPKKRKK